MYALQPPSKRLKDDIEYLVAQVIKTEIKQVKTSEKLRINLFNQNDFSAMKIFKAIDIYSHGSVKPDSLR